MGCYVGDEYCKCYGEGLLSTVVCRRKAVGDETSPEKEMEREASMLQQTTRSVQSITRFEF